MQTRLDIFKDTPTYSEMICRRIYALCETQNVKPERTMKVMSIKEILQTLK